MQGKGEKMKISSLSCHALVLSFKDCLKKREKNDGKKEKKTRKVPIK